MTITNAPRESSVPDGAPDQNNGGQDNPKKGAERVKDEDLKHVHEQKGEGREGGRSEQGEEEGTLPQTAPKARLEMRKTQATSSECTMGAGLSKRQRRVGPGPPAEGTGVGQGRQARSEPTPLGRDRADQTRNNDSRAVVTQAQVATGKAWARGKAVHGATEEQG